MIADSASEVNRAGECIERVAHWCADASARAGSSDERIWAT